MNSLDGSIPLSKNGRSEANSESIYNCSAGNQRNTAADIVNYHKSLGWKAPGYHYVIEVNGRVVNTLPVGEPSNGVKGHNSHIINVCYIGGVDTSVKGCPPIDNRTPQQKAALLTLLKQLKGMFPNAEILGHRDFPVVNKACPSFDAKNEYNGL